MPQMGSSFLDDLSSSPDKRLRDGIDQQRLAPSFEIEVFYDGGCPLCRREIDLLRRWDRRQAIRFTDIDSPDFPDEVDGKSYAQLMAQMHARLPEGTWLTGVEVFRRMYALVGFRWPVSLSRWPLISPALDVGYALFARYRLSLAGRCSAESCRVQPGAAAAASAPSTPHSCQRNQP
jgi:predicted DCC family thiol-disulfide oxidoreductase YuxK